MNQPATDKNQVWLYGASGHSLVIRDTLTDMGVSVAGCFEDDPNRLASQSEKLFHGMELHPGIRLGKENFSRPQDPMLVSIGRPEIRKQIAEQLGAPFFKAIHSSAIVSDSASIGDGTVVLHSAVVQTQSQIGNHVIINTGASVDHENVIEGFVNISPGATLCGNVHVKEGAFIGCGANIIPGICIGRWSVVGAGAVVIRDVPDNTIVVGNPGRIIGQRQLS